jgi:hypothetical protein
MPFEDGMRGRNLGLDRNRLGVEIEVDDAVDQREVIKVHGGRLSVFQRSGGRFASRKRIEPRI